jgi:hypothetical protein
MSTESLRTEEAGMQCPSASKGHYKEPDVKKRKHEFLSSDESPCGSVAFDGNEVIFNQHIKRPAAGRDLPAYTATAAVCITHMMQCDAGMKIHQTLTGNKDVVTVVVPLSKVLKLPVLRELWEVTVPQKDFENVSPGKVAHSRGSLSHSRSAAVPFNPPAAIWALVSLLLVQEDKIDMWSLFGNVDTDPRMAAHTILVCCCPPFRSASQRVLRPMPFPGLAWFPILFFFFVPHHRPHPVCRVMSRLQRTIFFFINILRTIYIYPEDSVGHELVSSISV